MRNVLNIAITEMVRRNATDGKITDDTCQGPALGGHGAREGFDWSQNLQGIILGAFYWGYVS